MYYIIFNPTAGAGRSVKTMQKIEQHLKQNHTEYTVHETEYEKHAVSIAAGAIGKGYKGIISVGGDGTLLEIAQVLYGTDEILGVIPAGTGNDFRQAIGVPKDPVAALDIILAGHSECVDIGFINNKKCFLNVAGTGFDVDVIKNTNKVRRLFTGGFAYYLGIVMSVLGYKSISIDITANGNTIRKTVLLIAIANGRCYGGGLHISPDASVQDGLFNVVIINRVAKWRILVELPKLKRGELEKIKSAEQFQCSEIVINCGKELSFNLDGELYAQTPAAFSLRNSALNVFCPE
ncbi:MAG: diacylglycerol kinase family lipid kinase [Eubacteriales bacterium]|nr:diacylglycerol kinase family lipid kinase [Eubacteriales bacterium]